MRRALAGVMGPRPRRTSSPARSAATPALRAARPAFFVALPAALVVTAPTSPATAASTAVLAAVATAPRRLIRSSSLPAGASLGRLVGDPASRHLRQPECDIPTVDGALPP